MTYRERMERRAEKRREWADKREARAEAASNRSHEMMDMIPVGQPILVGHHSEKRHRKHLDRAWNLMGQGVEHRDMAAKHDTAAETIERQLDRSIYDDDHDAIERIEEKIAELEAERERIKAYNRTARKSGDNAPGDLSLLTTKDQRDLAICIQVGQSKQGEFPPYVLQNLAGNIRRYRERLEAIKARQQRQAAAEDAGGVTYNCDEFYGTCTVAFAEAPPRETRQALKAAGFFYRKGAWYGRTENLPQAVRAVRNPAP